LDFAKKTLKTYSRTDYEQMHMTVNYELVLLRCYHDGHITPAIKEQNKRHGG